MSLRDCIIKYEYRSSIDNVVQDFYIPLLREAKVYRRAVGFFSSTSLIAISKGIASMAQNDGKMQIVSSPHLSDDDIEAIQHGYQRRNEIIENALLRELSYENTDYSSMERLNLLASLIADGVLDIRIAYTEDQHDTGMYHEKMGLIEDADGNVVAFSGSMNESSTAMYVNYETIDVFCNWTNETDRERVQIKQRAFHSIWNDKEPNVKVIEFPKVTDAMIEMYRKKKPNFNIDTEQFENENRLSIRGNMAAEAAPQKPSGARIPDTVSLHEYQKEAISNWVKENYCGIFDMATGTGKTYTGLGAIAKLSEDLGDELAVIIVCPFQHLVEQWVGDIRTFHMDPIIGYSSSSQKDWKKRLDKAIRDQKLRKDKSFFCFICTNATFTNPYVQECISRIKTPILLVVDEAHNFGAGSYAKYLDDRFTYRLALSATLERYRDEEGTDFLYSFFGKKCIEYTLERAIKEGKLTPYKYHPILVYLNEKELQEYEQKSYEMSKCLIKDKNGKTKLNKHGEMLAIERSRIVAAAEGKLDALRREIQPYIHQNNILVYCGAANVNSENDDTSEINESEVRQIEAVTRILGNEMEMKVAQFTSKESIEEREMIKEKFQTGDRLQALVAIKCLDEGVNIPGIRTAFILASTTNPKEYIQRRGRVLRKSENKEFAEIYDFVTLPRNLDAVSSLTKEQAHRDLSLVKNELARINEFGRMSMNEMDANRVIWNICDAYHIENITVTTKEEKDNG